MALDPSTLLAIAALVLGATGALMLLASRRESTRSALSDWGWGCVASAIGLALILMSPAAMTSPVRVLGNAAMMFGSGLVWAGARRFGGRSAPRPTAVAAGALGWLGIILAAAPPLGWRIAVSSSILAAYAFAAASELTRDRSRTGDTQRRVGIVLAAHGAFHAMRAMLGLVCGLAAWGPDLSRGWGAVVGIEIALFAILFGSQAIAMSGARAAGIPREQPLEDALTGIGNRRALSGSGAALLAGAAAEGRPLALLLMNLDGLRPVNDRHGRAAGDRLLVAFARLAHDYLPPTSLVCRLDGDVFAAVLPGAAPERALVVADELRSLFAHLVIDGANAPVAATVSIGVAQARSGRAALDELLDAAGRSLAAAKAAGRDYVVHEAELVEDGLCSAA